MIKLWLAVAAVMAYFTDSFVWLDLNPTVVTRNTLWLVALISVLVIGSAINFVRSAPSRANRLKYRFTESQYVEYVLVWWLIYLTSLTLWTILEIY